MPVRPHAKLDEREVTRAWRIRNSPGLFEAAKCVLDSSKGFWSCPCPYPLIDFLVWGGGDQECAGPGDPDAENVGPAACGNGLDDDGDGAIDALDAGCVDGFDASERGSVACDDGFDNEGDGFLDFGHDAGCSSAADISELSASHCDDGLDNDCDGGYIDFNLLTPEAHDPGCASSSDASEVGSVECDNGVDDDGDIVPDYHFGMGCPGSDVECTDPRDETEWL